MGSILPNIFEMSSKGLPDTSSLPSSVTMSRQFYVNSLLLQVLLLLVFVLYFIVSIYRVVKKIKNHRFQDIPEDDKKQEDEANKTELDAMNQHQVQKDKENQQPQNLIYRFDEEDDQHDFKKKEPLDQETADEKNQHAQPDLKDRLSEDKEDSVEQKSAKSIPDNYNDYHDENEEAFIELDDKLLFLLPFLMPFVISNNFFTTDAVTLVAAVLMLGCYFLFNIKGHLGRFKVMPVLFMVCSLAGFISFFSSDHDLTT